MSNCYVIYRADLRFVICRADLDVLVIALRNLCLYHLPAHSNSFSKCDAVGSFFACMYSFR